MCEQCSDVSERRELRSPSQYAKLLRQLNELVEDQIFDLASGPPMAEILAVIQDGSPWPSDTVTHVVRCTSCGQHFTLFADTYHGAGRWHAQ